MDKINSADVFDDVISAFGDKLEYLRALDRDIKRQTTEIRIRSGREIMLTLLSGEIIGTGGRKHSSDDMHEILMCLCKRAIYSHQEEIARGYITMSGGHRAGLCGSAVLTGGEVTAMRDISSVNLRIARQIRGCGDECVSRLFEHGICGCIIAGAPCSGKTTILRDIALTLSEIKQKVTIVDERGELAAMHAGEPRFDIGNCDVLDSFPKSTGILHAIRCLSPDVIICDEAGNSDDCAAICEGTNAGVKVIASVHTGSFEELRRRQQIKELLKTGAFEKIALLSNKPNPGTLVQVIDAGEII